MPVCTCSLCKHWTFKDFDGSYRSGRRVDSPTAKAHQNADRMARKARAVARLEGGSHPKGTPDHTVDGIARALNKISIDADQGQPERGDNGDATGTGSTDSADIAEKAKTRISELGVLESVVTLRSRLISSYMVLKFESPPVTITDPPTELERAHRGSHELLLYHSWVSQQVVSLGALPPIGDKQADRHLETLISKFKAEVTRVDKIVLLAWRKEMVTAGLLYLDARDIPEPVQCPPSKIFDPAASGLPPFIMAALFLVTILHSLAAISRPQVQLVLATLKVMLFGAFTWQTNPLVSAILTQSQEALLRCVPLDIRTTLSSLYLEPEMIIYAACPACHTTYAPDPSKPDDPYPHVCSHVETDRAPCCGTLVFSEVIASRNKRDPPRTVYRPVQPFPFRSLKSWLEQLLRRSDIEDLLENSWKRGSHGGVWEDVMDAPAIRKFLGPDGQTRFSVETNGSLHLVFSLFIDWFNPHGNKAAGKKHSIGAIYLVLLGLPPHLRFRPENVYLAAIIPGPSEPSLEQINHFLRPLVDELLEFWHSGVYFLRTAKRRLSRMVRVAVIPLICDLPALRKTAGFAHHSSNHFCSFCTLRKTDISNVERSTWPKARTRAEHLKIAKAWRDAKTERSREKLFDQHGLRWSELLRLPYWDPTRFALLDTMHNLFLGELRHHCHDVWKLTGIGERPERVLALHTPAEQKTQLDRILGALKKYSDKGLKAVRRDYLLAVANFNEIALPDRPTKAEIAEALLNKVDGVPVDRVATVIQIPPPHAESVNLYHPPGYQDNAGEYSKVFSFEVLDHIRKDIANILVPSWIEKPPSNFGSSAHGKLKADHWRTVSTIHMVITLVRLWGQASATDIERAALRNFIHLVVAVDSATRRSMSASRAKIFDENIEAYVKGLRGLYGHALVPNHHLSLHLEACLLLFGPVHGWWSYPFERFNGLFQRMNTNHRTRDMPVTFMRYWYIGSSLRWLICSVRWPDMEVFKDWMAAFTTAFKDAARGTRFADMLSFLSSPDKPYTYDEHGQTFFSREVYDQLYNLIYPPSRRGPKTLQSAYDATLGHSPSLPSAGHFISTITQEGIKYSTSSSGLRDSLVTFTVPTDDNQLTITKVAGRIEGIFYHRRREGRSFMVEPFLIVKQYMPLAHEHENMDPFRAFPGLDTQLYYDQFQPQERVIRLSDVIAHFAAFTYIPEGIEKQCIVARSLDRS